MKRSRLEAIALPVFAASLFLVVWHFGCVVTHTKVFPSPPAVVRALVELVHKGLLFKYLRDSLLRVAGGYSLAVILGIPVGMLMGWYPGVASALNPVVQMLRPISPLAWIPVAIVLFGVTDGSAVFLIFLGAFFPVVVTTMNGVANVPRIYLRAGRNFSLSPFTLFFRIILPASLPQILTGLRIALGIAWLVVVAAEMIAVDSGLGYLIIDSRNAGKRYDLVVAGMLLIGLVGLLLDLLVRRVERMRSVRWGFRSE